jgi:hypothetical protein
MDDKEKQSHKVTFGTSNRRVIIILDPLPTGPLSLSPWQAREWSRRLKRLASLAETIPNPALKRSTDDRQHSGD